MTRDDIIRMAREAGWTSCANDIYPPLEKFAAIVAAAEREACAKVCDARVIGDHNREDQEAKRCAAAIRARNKQEQPVAWSHNLIENIITHRPADIDRHPDRWTPLYAEPKPCPTCQAAVAAVEQGQSR